MTHRRLLALALALGATPALAAKAPRATPTGRKVASVQRAQVAAKAPAVEGDPDPAAARVATDTYAYLKVPLLAPQVESTPVAVVDDEPVTMGQLEDAIATTHEARPDGSHAGSRDLTPLVDRLITLRLFVLEARDMGLDEQPGFAKAVAEFKEQQLRRLTELRVTRGVRPDAIEVERLYRDAAREWKVRSVLFEKREDAVSFRAAIAEGKKFVDLAKEALAAKRASGTDAADWVGRGKMLPQVAEAVARIDKAPGCTDPVEVKGGFAVAAVEEIRTADDPKARAMAEAASVERQQTEKLGAYRTSIEKKYARRDEALWKALDFEAPKPGFAALAKDRRAVVTLKGAKPVTVADVAAELGVYFFHGVEEPLKEKKLNAAKEPVLHKILTRRLFLLAGTQAGIPQSAEFKKAVKEYEDSLLFGSYVEKVIIPDVKVTEDEGKAYYEQHRAEFTLPGFYKLEALAFAKPQAADAALKKLSAGTDFTFLRANAEGQIPRDDRVLSLDGQTLSAKTLPPELLTALAGAKRDDLRTVTTAGQSYVIRVVEVTPPKEQPYAEARAAIGKKLAAENLNKAVKDVATKLRASHQVAVYLERVGN